MEEPSPYVVLRTAPVLRLLFYWVSVPQTVARRSSSAHIVILSAFLDIFFPKEVCQSEEYLSAGHWFYNGVPCAIIGMWQTIFHSNNIMGISVIAEKLCK
jgi:hypothetical protein